ncbi:hypothetical protein P7K49_011553 [Saguinus oedipus]|uniref:Uncharacterized protein n=1 Tax=Saguinus oedipus TaxID=9490 RepID=A0ABQ9VRA0_SAGOE|nr:hypothetical protein P7K49_011553 [Saguinus oedipus]
MEVGIAPLPISGSMASGERTADVHIHFPLSEHHTCDVEPVLRFMAQWNLPSRFKFKEYCPMVFRNLRERFGIDDQDYQVWSFLAISEG